MVFFLPVSTLLSLRSRCSTSCNPSSTLWPSCPPPSVYACQRFNNCPQTPARFPRFDLLRHAENWLTWVHMLYVFRAFIFCFRCYLSIFFLFTSDLFSSFLISLCLFPFVLLFFTGRMSRLSYPVWWHPITLFTAVLTAYLTTYRGISFSRSFVTPELESLLGLKNQHGHWMRWMSTGKTDVNQHTGTTDCFS